MYECIMRLIGAFISFLFFLYLLPSGWAFAMIIFVLLFVVGAFKALIDS